MESLTDKENGGGHLKRLWLHGASHGDQEGLAPLAERARRAGYHRVRSAVTPSGRARARALDPQALHLRAPLLWGAPQMLSRARPIALCLELLEVWPHWVRACERAGVPVVVINARVSERTLRARRLLRSSFERLSLVLAQRPIDAERAVLMGAHPERVQVCGNSKYDALLSHTSLSSLPASLPPISPSSARPLQLILGAWRPEDEGPLLANASSLKGMSALIAPRYPQRAFRLKRALERYGLSVSLRSEARDEPLLYWVESNRGASLLLLDTLGELSGLYPHAEAALLGGSFRGRAQNMIEAARAGCAIAYGPRAVSALSLEVEALERAGGVRRAERFDEALRWALNASALGGEALERRLVSLDVLKGAGARQWSALNELI